MKRKLLSILLTFCLAFSLLPTAALADGEGAQTNDVAQIGSTGYESLAAAIEAAKSGNTVKLLRDTKENVTIDKAMTLDLNGHTLNGGTEKGKPALTITARTVTIKDSSEAQTGTIMREDTAENSGVSSHYVIDIQGNAWVMFESGNVKNNSGNTAGKGASLVRVGDDSVDKFPGLNIKGGTFTQDNFIVIKVDRGDLFLNGGTLSSANSYAVENWHRAKIKGGTVNGAVSSWTYSGGSNSTLTISGGTVNGNVLSVNYGSAESKVAKVEITGGTVNGALGTYTYSNDLVPTEETAKATIEVTGGSFDKDPSKYVTEDAKTEKNGDGSFGVSKVYLCKIGDTGYYTMDEAFKAQTASREPIVLLRDYTTGSTFNSGDASRVVDLNNHTWTCTGKDANSAAFAINYPNAALTVKNGKIVSSQLVGLIPSASSLTGPITYDNSSLTFENVEMTTTATSGIETNGNNTNDSVTLKNSTLNVPNGFGIYFPSSGTLTLDNSTVTAKTMGVQVCAGSLSINEGSAVTVTGDAVPKAESDGAIQDGAAISVVNRTGYKGLGAVTVSGGKFTAKEGNSAIKAYDWANATESDFTADKGTVAVSGGTFSSAVPDNCCAPGFVPKANSDGTHGVKINENMAAEVLDAQGNTVAAYDTLADALNAVKDGETIKLLKDANLSNAEYYINKSVTINGSGKKISCTVKTGETTRAFVVEENGSLTLDGVVLDIQGTKNPDTAEKNDGTGIDVQFGGKLVLKNQAVLKLHDLERGTISSKPDGSPEIPGQFVIDNSTFNSTNIDGNISNGGDWTVTNGSTVNINNCGSYGLSVDSLTTEQSTVNISGTGYSAIYGKDLQFKDGSNVLINGAGTELPLQSKWSDARSPIQTHKDGGTIVVESGATVTVRDCKDKDGKANNTIYLPKNTTYTNNGTVNATIITADAPEDSCVVTLVSDGKTIGVQTVPKDSVFTLPAAPKKNNYTFNGWYDGSKFYAAGASYKVSATVTLNASWSYISSGSSSYDPTYSVTVDKTENGAVTVSPKSASKGDRVTVTVKPDSGYVLETLTVTDKNGNELTLKDKGNGKYTFTMPAGKVEVKATFMEDNSMLNFFYDVPNNAYFYEAVKWAVKNGITTGVGNDLFAPEQPCTRAQIVTFLWRAAGSPEPKGAASGMTDVVSGSYYEKAVAWAIENGITTGTTTSTFSPDATCTRAQAVTFLARALKAKAASAAEFSDVPTDSYFADAVAWAAANGVTEGIGGGLFGSDNDCTRGQIVTFLYRAYNK